MGLIHDAAARALRRLDPEDAHGLTIKGLKTGLGPRDVGRDDPILATEIAGLKWPPVLMPSPLEQSPFSCT